MTTIRTTGPITDDVELVNAAGDRLEIHFSFTPSGPLAKKVREMQVALVHAKQTPSEDTETVVGQIVLQLFDMVFGAENTQKILAFYAGQYEPMGIDLLPYIRDNVVPACQQFVKSARAKAKAPGRWRR